MEHLKLLIFFGICYYASAYEQYYSSFNVHTRNITENHEILNETQKKIPAIVSSHDDAPINQSEAFTAAKVPMKIPKTSAINFEYEKKYTSRSDDSKFTHSNNQTSPSCHKKMTLFEIFKTWHKSSFYRAVESFLRSLKDGVDMRKPWSVKETITYGPRHSMQIHLNVTGMLNIHNFIDMTSHMNNAENQDVQFSYTVSYLKTYYPKLVE